MRRGKKRIFTQNNHPKPQPGSKLVAQERLITKLCELYIALKIISYQTDPSTIMALTC